ncbi:Pentatricopeptide repeat-containing protein [Thalictrum thalictroides]|uniref:Pentatricopeptide repeat-containing protein n=1 Tax=Thalictrum thalictroides TaxID=46969 RepID=A0A7J6UTG1_THATH|nr:Pentatricopeptide repeat-containing protein [Thalictrum thalictroides]
MMASACCWIKPTFETKFCIYNQNPKPKTRVFLGFKLYCNSKTAKSVVNGKKKRYGGYGGSLPSILQALDNEDDEIDKTMESWVGKLSPKEQTVILKEQRDWVRLLQVFRWMKLQNDYVANVIHYNVVLRVLGRAQKWDELRLCWIEMAKDGVFPSNNTYGMLVDVYAKAGLVKEALLWIKHMKQRNVFPDEVTMNTVVRVLKDVGEFEKGDKFFKNWCQGKIELDCLDLDSINDFQLGLVDPFSPKHFLSTELFKAGGRMPPSKLLSPMDEESSVRKPRLTATYNTLIDLYGKAGRLKDASNAFAEMLKSGVAPDTVTFNTMIYTCGTHGLLSEAEFLLTRMEEKGVCPDTKTYNIFLSLYADQGNIDASLKCYKKIREVGLLPDTVTHRAVLRILCERKMVTEVESVIEEMNKSNVRIDEHSLPAIIRMYVDVGLLDQAKSLFESRHLEGRISSKTYAAIIDVYADKGLWTEAEAVFFRKMNSLVHKKDVVEFNVMIKAYGKSKLYDRAISLFKNMRSNGTWPEECTYNSLVQMLGNGGLVDLARDFLAEMQETGFKPQCSTFSAVITGCIRLGQISDAVDVYREMTKAGVQPNEVVYGSLINGFAEAGMVEEALEYFHAMEEVGIHANQIVLTSLIKAYSKVGCLEGAQKLYGRMMNMQGGPDIVASNSMITLYADHGIVGEANLIFDKLKENGQADGVSYATMMHLYKNMGMIDKAIDISQEMQESNLLRDCASFNAVLTSYATNGQLRECGELLQQMIKRKILPDAGTFKVMLTVLKKGGAPTEAVNQIESSYREGKRFAREALVTFVFTIVGLHTFALECCKAFMKSETSLDSYAFNIAIYAYGCSGKVDEALTIFMRMQDEGLEPDLVTYINLVVCYGRAGIVEGIKRIYNQVMYGEIEPNESLFTAVINAYKDANRNDLAELVSQEMKFAIDTEDLPDSEAEGDDDPLDFSEPLEPVDYTVS